MKKVLLLFVFQLIRLSAFATVETDLHVYAFQQEGQKYIEVYTRVSAESLTWVDVESKPLASVEILLLIRKIEGDTIHAQKLLLNSSNNKKDLMDVRRIAMENGEFEVILEVIDSNLKTSSQTLFYPFDVKEELGIQQSSLILNVDNKSCTSQSTNCKNGLSIEPLPWNISVEENELVFLYNELTHADWLQAPFYIAYGLRSEKGEDVAKRYKKLQPDPQIILNLPFDVSGLVSGEYNFFIDVYNEGKVLMSSTSSGFTKINPKADLEVISLYNEDVKNSWVHNIPEEDLVFDLKSIWPLVANHRTATLDKITRSGGVDLQRHFIYTFWKEQGGASPESSYYQYREVAKAVDKRFYNTVGYGTETDRGYIYLKYGKPNDIIAVEDEPTAPPYQIWRYNYIPKTKQSNVKFIFYNPSLVSNDFRLLHGTCRGELQNPAWEVELYNRAPWDQEGATIEATRVTDNFNRNARRLFEDL